MPDMFGHDPFFGDSMFRSSFGNMQGEGGGSQRGSVIFEKLIFTYLKAVPVGL